MDEKLLELINAPDTMERIFKHLANGGSLIALCKTWDVRYSDIAYWINQDEGRKKKYQDGCNAQVEWGIHRLLQEIRAVSFVDIRQLFNEDHSIKKPSEWPDDIAAAIAGVETDELFEGTGAERRHIGETKKVKLFDKLKALEMLGRDLGRLVNRHEVTGKITLEDLVTGSIKKEQ